MRNHNLKANFNLFMASFILFLLLSGCQNAQSCKDSIGCHVIKPGQPLTIGIERATTGDESQVSQSMIEAVKYAASQQPLFYRHPIQFFIQDTPCTLRDHAFSTSVMLSQPDLVAVIGPVCQEGDDAYAKSVSDAGIPLLSPAKAIAVLNLPGVYNIFPSNQALAEGLDSVLSSASEIKNIDLVVWNEAVDLQFATIFCAVWQKHGYRCGQVLSLRPENLKISEITGSLTDPFSSLIFILPFSELNQIPDVSELPNKHKVFFFDPELNPWIKSEDPYWESRSIITYHWPKEYEGSNGFLSTGPGEIRSLLAYDTFGLLIKSLTGSVEVAPDGKITIFREKLRQSIEKIVDFNGLAGHYSCTDRNSCLQMDGFLKRTMPNP